MPGGPERALSTTARIKQLATITMLMSGVGAGLLFTYRAFFSRSGSITGPGLGLFTSLASWWANYGRGKDL